MIDIPYLGGLNLEMVSTYVAMAVYVAAGIQYITRKRSKIHRTAGQALALLFGPAWAVAVCGLLVNNVLHHDIAKRDKTTPLGRRVGDILGHLLPAAIVTLRAPDMLAVTKCAYSAFVIVAVALLAPWLRRVYVGVPGWVVWGLGPAVALIATHLRYWPPRI